MLINSKAKEIKMELKYDNPAGKYLCRICQGILKAGMFLLPWRTPEVLRGEGSSVQLPALIREKGFEKALIVTGQNVRRHGLLDDMLKVMDELGPSYVIYDGSHPNPTDKDVEAGVRIYNDNDCQAIIAFGGGSPMDCAKGIAAMASRPGKTVRQLQGLFKVRKKTPPVFAVPTTAGTGSETTIAAVITEDSTHHKASINDLCLMPEVAVLDPALTRGLSPQITAATGFDALCHAVECYTNGTYNSRLENDYAEKAVKLIYDNLYAAYKDGGDMNARQNMQEAAFLAGRAFTRGCVGYVHAIGHTLGGLYGVPHGLAMAVILPHVMRYFGASVEPKLSRLADICGLSGSCDREKADVFIRWIDHLKENTGIPGNLDMIREEDIPQIIKWAIKEANPVYPVPQIWGEKDFREVLKNIKGES